MQVQARSRISCSLFPGESWHQHRGYMIPNRLPWRLRARPSATLHEIQVRSEERTRSGDVIEVTGARSRTIFGRENANRSEREREQPASWKSAEISVDRSTQFAFQWLPCGCCRRRIRVPPPPPRRCGIMGLEENFPLIQGVQWLRRKILIPRGLRNRRPFACPLLRFDDDLPNAFRAQGHMSQSPPHNCGNQAAWVELQERAQSSVQREGGCSLPHTFLHARTMMSRLWRRIPINPHCGQVFASDRERQRNCAQVCFSEIQPPGSFFCFKCGEFV